MHVMTSDLLIPFVQSLPGCKVQPGLYIVATPIGHLSDISLRALAVLSQVDLIACEDTRVTSKLLNIYNIKKPLLPYHNHNAQQVTEKIVAQLEAGRSIALVSDAGTPLISDPGFEVINECIKNNIYVTSIPGSNAAITALTLSGLSVNRFLFLGFLSSRSIARKKELSAYKTYAETLILYEAPHRIAALLQDAFDVLGDRKIVLARELTKKFETIQRGTIAGFLKSLSTIESKGEFVVIIEGVNTFLSDNITDEEIIKLFDHVTTKDIAEQLSQAYSVSKKEIYQRILQLKNRNF